MGEFNAKINQGRVLGLTGDFGLGETEEGRGWWRLYIWIFLLYTANIIIRNQINSTLIPTSFLPELL